MRVSSAPIRCPNPALPNAGFIFFFVLQKHAQPREPNGYEAIRRLEDGGGELEELCKKAASVHPKQAVRARTHQSLKITCTTPRTHADRVRDKKVAVQIY